MSVYVIIVLTECLARRKSDSRRRLKHVIPGVGFLGLGVGLPCFLNSLFKNGGLVKSIVTGILTIGHMYIYIHIHIYTPMYIYGALNLMLANSLCI